MRHLNNRTSDDHIDFEQFNKENLCYKCPACDVFLEHKGKPLSVMDIDVCGNDEFLQLMCLIEEVKSRDPGSLRVIYNLAYTIGASISRWNIAQHYALATLIDSLDVMKITDPETLKSVRQQLISGVEGLENRAWELTSNTGKPGEL